MTIGQAARMWFCSVTPSGRNVLAETKAFSAKRSSLNGTPFTVIGVLPATLKFPFAQNQVWLPRVFEQEGLPPDIIQRGTGYLTTLGRLKPGVSREQADEQLHVIDKRYAAANPGKGGCKGRHERHLVSRRSGRATASDAVDAFRRRRVRASGCLRERRESPARPFHRASQGDRRSHRARRHSNTHRHAISGGECPDRRRSQVSLGVLLAVWGLDLLKKVAENFLPRVLEISLDLTVLGFAVGLSLLTGVVLGLIPALHASRSDPIDSFKDSSRGTTGRQAGRLRAGLLIAEVALSLVLLVGAVLVDR